MNFFEKFFTLIIRIGSVFGCFFLFVLSISVFSELRRFDGIIFESATDKMFIITLFFVISLFISFCELISYLSKFFKSD